MAEWESGSRKGEKEWRNKASTNNSWMLCMSVTSQYVSKKQRHKVLHKRQKNVDLQSMKSLSYVTIELDKTCWKAAFVMNQWYSHWLCITWDAVESEIQLWKGHGVGQGRQLENSTTYRDGADFKLSKATLHRQLPSSSEKHRNGLKAQQHFVVV